MKGLLNNKIYIMNRGKPSRRRMTDQEPQLINVVTPLIRMRVEDDDGASTPGGDSSSSSSTTTPTLSRKRMRKTAKNLKALTAAYPTAPRAELERFARAKESTADAVALYEAYLSWRQTASFEDAKQVEDPKFLTTVELSDEQVLVMVEGARYDLDIDADAYVSMICEKLDKVLPAESPRRLVVLLDVRGGKGWPNPPAWKLLSFVRKCNAVIPNVYPERLETIVVYPLPTVLRYLGNMILALLDPVTRAKVVLLGAATESDHDNRRGNNTIVAPAGALRACVGQHILNKIPDHAKPRHTACFCDEVDDDTAMD